MKNQKNELIELTPQQSNPGSARATDFEVRPYSPMATPFHNQRGRTKAEQARMIREGLNTLGKSPTADIPERNIAGGK